MIKIVYFDDIEELMLTKHEIDLYLLKTKQESKKMTVDEFFKYIGQEFHQYFLTDKQGKTTVLTYNIKNINNINYFFTTRENENMMNSFIQHTKDIADKKYEQCDEVYIAKNAIREYLMIGNTFYMFKN